MSARGSPKDGMTSDSLRRQIATESKDRTRSAYWLLRCEGCTPLSVTSTMEAPAARE